MRSFSLATLCGLGALVLCSGPALAVVPSGAAPAAGKAPGVALSPSMGLPAFQPGMWEYRRTLVSTGSGQPQMSTVKKCADPTADIQQKMAELRKKNCQFATPRRIQDHYVSNWVCPTPNGPARFHDVLTAKDTIAYQDVSEARVAQRITRSSIEAVRIGACPLPGMDVPHSRPHVPPMLRHPASSATE
jgi:hypothetical protein